MVSPALLQADTLAHTQHHQRNNNAMTMKQAAHESTLVPPSLLLHKQASFNGGAGAMAPSLYRSPSFTFPLSGHYGAGVGHHLPLMGSFASPLSSPPPARVKRLSLSAAEQPLPFLFGADLNCPVDLNTPLQPLYNQHSMEAEMSDAFAAQFASAPSTPMGLSAPSLDLPPLERATTEQFAAVLAQQQQNPCHPDSDQPGASGACWLKQQQFDEGWPVDPSQSLFGEGLDTVMSAFDPSSVLSAPLIKTEQEPMQLTRFESQETAEEEKTGSVQEHFHLTPAAPGAGQGYEQAARVQGKLARYLPDGVDPCLMDSLSLPPTRFSQDLSGFSLGEPLVAPAPSSAASSTAEFEHKLTASGRSLRVRKVRSRSPSPVFSDSDRSDAESDSGYDTDSYSRDNNAAEEDLDDSMSPPPARGMSHTLYGGDSSSGQSSAEPPQPTNLLPVSARDLLPSRPSHAVIPPAHLKDRLVKSAKKLLTAADGFHDSVQVQVIPIWYPSKGSAGAHKIRLIRVFNTETETVSMYAHAADVGGVVERKSNISRLFGKFESPAEKLLMNVVGAHNHTVGQESNILTSKGVRKFLATNKMKDEHVYRQWITDVMLPKLSFDPLEIGEELLEIEASTDPNAPTRVKPKKMKRMEKKRALAKTQQRKQAAAAAATRHDDDGDDDDYTPSSPQSTHQAMKKTKYVHSPLHNGAQSAPIAAASSSAAAAAAASSAYAPHTPFNPMSHAA